MKTAHAMDKHAILGGHHRSAGRAGIAGDRYTHLGTLHLSRWQQVEVRLIYRDSIYIAAPIAARFL